MTFGEITSILARRGLPSLARIDYEVLTTAMQRGDIVLFDYLDKADVLWRYRRVHPRDFFAAGKVYLNAWHDLHKSNHTFRAWAISNVATLGNLIDAIIDMERYKEFWDGSSMALETTLI